MGASGAAAAAPLPERRRRYPGRLRVPDRAALAGVMYVLRTGVAWRDVPARAWAALQSRPGAGCGTGPRPASRPACTPPCWPSWQADLLGMDDCAVDGSHVSAPQGLLELACSIICLRRLRTSFRNDILSVQVRARPLAPPTPTRGSTASRLWACRRPFVCGP
ncbi:hypothetical protein D9753_35345 [Streptomyces dangxiongensis]|uniref:Insertion element IS402-like domain-containing protein n=1 Tax=Streptomyces dangxiongensis TaxID=1442032 RepID=A0A3G2JLG6_9ACTN|nr:hypothetical protein D9753_35345 [Streptomyces dangxiongensis]